LEIRFEEIWRERGPHDHAFAIEYRSLGAKLVRSVNSFLGGRANLTSLSHALTLNGIAFNVSVDDQRETAEGPMSLSLLKTGTDRGKTATEDDAALVLLHLAARELFGERFAIHVFHLSDEVMRPVALTATKLDNRRDKVSALATRLKRGEFPPLPDETRCPRCPHWFACGQIPDGSLRISG
jgi:hypothetical protein